MVSCSPQRSYERARRIAWILAAAAVSYDLWRLSTGCAPAPGLDVWHVGKSDSPVPATHAALIFYLALISGWLVFPKVVGRKRVENPVAVKRISASSLEAEQWTNSGLAALLPFGFSIGPTEPLPSGAWRVTAFRNTFSLGGDPRRAKQSLEFSFASRELVMTHHLWGRYIETGEVDYQHWLLESISGGLPLAQAPRTLMAKPLCAVSVGVLLFADALLIQSFHGVGGEGRAAFVAAMSAAVTTYLGMAASVWVQRRWTRGASLFFPAAVLLASAMLLWAFTPGRY